MWTFHQSLQTLSFFFVATQGHQRNSSSGAKTAGTFDGFGAQKVPWGVSQQNMDGFDAILVQTFTCLGATTAREPWSRVRGCGRGMAACGIDHNFH